MKPTYKYLDYVSEYNTYSVNTCFRVNKMANNLFWKLRDTIFAMDKRGEAFPTPIAHRVLTYAPATLFNYPSVLAEITCNLHEVVSTWDNGNELLGECQEAINELLEYYQNFSK